jgi:hypothetical protein
MHVDIPATEASYSRRKLVLGKSVTPAELGVSEGTAKGGYRGFWDERWDFMRTQASIATDPTACPPSPDS